MSSQLDKESPQMDAYLASLSDRERATLGRDSRKALRDAWPHRHDSFRAPHVIRANVIMLRRLGR